MDDNHAEIEQQLCKGCRLCIEFCPRQCLGLGSEINNLGYQYARFVNPQCTACGFCYYICPEPGAVKVFKADAHASAGA